MSAYSIPLLPIIRPVSHYRAKYKPDEQPHYKMMGNRSKGNCKGKQNSVSGFPVQNS